MDIPWWYFIIAAAIGIVVGLCKKPSLGILAGYTFLLLVETVLIRKPFEGSHFQPVPFWSWREWKIQRNQILTNIAVFIPTGIFAGRLWKWKGLWVAAGLSISIEFLQLITRRGLCEFDDVIHNCLGAAIGVALVVLSNRFISKDRGM